MRIEIKMIYNHPDTSANQCNNSNQVTKYNFLFSRLLFCLSFLWCLNLYKNAKTKINAQTVNYFSENRVFLLFQFRRNLYFLKEKSFIIMTGAKWLQKACSDVLHKTRPGWLLSLHKTHPVENVLFHFIVACELGRSEPGSSK